MSETEGPRIYVASLSDYNAGRLHGRWIDADQSADEIGEQVREMLAESTEPGAEEWAIHDHEGFYGLSVSEWETFERVSEWAQQIAEHGAAFAAYVLGEGAEYATAEGFAESYNGEHRSMAEFAEELADDMGALPADPPWPLSYIDWERAGRDLELGGDYWTADVPAGESVYPFGAVYVFRSS